MMPVIEIKCSPKEILSNNAVKNGKFKEICADTCGFLNHSHGGSVCLLIEDRGIGFKATPMRTFLRGIEQRLVDTFGETVYCIGIERIEHSDYKVEFLVNSGKNVGIKFFTVKTNLYLPGHEEVHQVSDLELCQSILCRTVIWKMVSIHTHIKRFEKNTDSSLIEGRTLQLKNLESNPSKRTTLADRITKGNKFTCYVSAFANFYGGHIYYGINDDRVVEGQLIPNEEDKNEITKKVEKVINKMIWPEQIGQPKRGEHWEIFFEPVVDENSKPIPSTFVIVIYVAPCLGGVFTDEPECYEMVEGKRKKMSLSAWKRRLFSSVASPEIIPSAMKRIAWSDRKIEQACTKIVDTAMELINNGQYAELPEVLVYYKEKFPRVIDVNLMTISRDVMGCIRTGSFEKAYSLLKRYNEILPQAEDVMIFEALLLFLLVCLRRSEGQLNKDWSLIDDLINRTVLLPPGPLTAAIYALCTTVSPEEHSGLSIPVLCEKTRSQVRNCFLDQDVARKVDIFEAFYSLGCDFSEGFFLKDLSKVNLEAAKSLIAPCEGQLTNRYRKTQFSLAKSVLHVRGLQLNEDDKELCLVSARKYCMQAELIANKCQFHEMINLAKHVKDLFASL